MNGNVPGLCDGVISGTFAKAQTQSEVGSGLLDSLGGRALRERMQDAKSDRSHLVGSNGYQLQLKFWFVNDGGAYMKIIV
ncbi:hypothetical protein DID88_003815 [Monilinia fructigena]|uniref:Uncharacterized protein n=1 Tax=Monilinia fructigena TaxID=38457 RepID=A0A395ITC2_9HELO|nr:hypothetical protein DID88_003815 [Monilinia fructigena]